MKNKTRLFIGDIHGSPYWEELCKNPDNHEAIIFLGDYMDSFEYTNKEVIENFRNIVYFANQYKDKVYLLLGNHDIQYMFWHTNLHPLLKCSGYAAANAWKAYYFIWNNIDLFSIAYQYKNIIATHAGITNNFYKNFIETYTEPNGKISDTLNNKFKYQYKPLFNIPFSRGGSSEIPGIFWADEENLKEDPLEFYTQIIGHTVSTNIRYFEYKEKRANLYFIDTNKIGSFEIGN